MNVSDRYLFPAVPIGFEEPKESAQYGDRESAILDQASNSKLILWLRVVQASYDMRWRLFAMFRSKCLVLFLLIGVLSPFSLPSAAPLKLLELDDMSCSAWKKQTAPELREPYVQWVRGFLSGHNYANQSKQVSEVSSGTVAAFVDRYCSEHSAATVSEAAMRMSDRYSGRNTPITR